MPKRLRIGSESLPESGSLIALKEVDRPDELPQVHSLYGLTKKAPAD
jgi:hypothetical protein